ncbi:fucolectin-1-like [Haliotis rufescens]|uniref:fucolectin-1-like n=1 Tax=Haliotis rufescens TaxID=6454 RepID=UPI00201EB495|nr:fucolectin-1-like [Haliotis rufescens]
MEFNGVHACWFILALVAKFGWCNIALNKPTHSSTDYDGKSSSSHAVDGNLDAVRSHSSCFTSSATSPWWMVDLQGNYRITSVSIQRRSDGFAYRLRDLAILAFREDPQQNPSTATITCTEKTGTLGAMDTLSCDQPVVARFVKIQYLPIFTEILTLCEVQISGDICSRDTTQCTNTAIDIVQGMYIVVESVDKRIVNDSTQGDCTNKCYREHKCHGFNFNTASKTCELVLKTPTQVVSDAGSVYSVMPSCFLLCNGVSVNIC